jgi:hypothetical protein
LPLYLQIAQKEPFDILYFNPAIEGDDPVSVEEMKRRLSGKEKPKS